MTGRLVAVMLLTLAGGVASAGGARATVIYNLLAGTTTGPGGAPSSRPLSLQLTLFGGFAPGAFSRQCNMGCYAQTGSFTDFQLTAFDGATVLGVLDNMPDRSFEQTTGTLNRASGKIDWNTSNLNIDLTFGKGIWTASFNSDSSPYGRECAGGLCTASGVLTEVPEPASIALLGFGLLALAAARRWPGRAG